MCHDQRKTMIKKWIVIPSLLVITLSVALYTIDTWVPFLMDLKPKPEIVIDKATRKEAVTTLIAKLNEHYVFPDKAKQVEAVLLKHLKDGRYDAMTDGEQFAYQLTLDLRGMARDLHMSVRARAEPVPHDRAVAPPPTTKAQWEQRTPALRRNLLELGLMMGKVGTTEFDHLDDNIGYLKLTDFPPHFIMAERYATVMDKLADTGSLIMDLRDNDGGSPETVAMLVSYFVDERTRVNDLWDRTSGVTTQQWTLDKVDGKRYGTKRPVVILVSRETMSAGEDFAYTMQALGRATVIGESTWGGAHPTRSFRLGEHFAAWIPSRRSINPITGSNWEGVGVIPDIAVSPDNAMEVAKDVLQRRLLVPVRQVAAVPNL
jgi:hypothetical protein